MKLVVGLAIQLLITFRLLQPQLLHMHVGHASAPSGGESHFRISIKAKEFSSLSRLDRQRAVHEALDELLQGPIHALSITASAPDET